MLKRGTWILALIVLGLCVLGCDSAVETEPSHITISTQKIFRPDVKTETRVQMEKELDLLIEQNNGKLEVEVPITVKLTDKEKLKVKEIKDQEAYLPFAFDVNENGDVYMLHMADNTLVIFNKIGEPVKEYKISGVNLTDIAVSRTGETIFLIDYAGNKLLAMNPKGEKVYQGRPPRLFEGSDLNTLSRVFVVDENTIAFVGDKQKEALALNLKKNKWERTPHFTTYGRDGKFYLLERNKITWWGGVHGFKNAETHENDTLFMDGLAGLFGVDRRGYVYIVVDITSETFTKEHPDCTVFIDEPLGHRATAIKLPFGDLRLGYDGAAYVVPFITKNHVSPEIPIYRIKFGQDFKMEKVVPRSYEK